MKEREGVRVFEDDESREGIMGWRIYGTKLTTLLKTPGICVKRFII